MKHDVPLAGFAMSGGIAGVRASGLDDVRSGSFVFVGRKTDAAGIYDRAAIGQAHEPLQMRVATKHERRVEGSEFCRDVGGRGERGGTACDGFEEVVFVAVRRGVKGDPVVALDERGKLVQPAERVRIEPLAAESGRTADVRSAFAGHPVAVAAHVNGATGAKELDATRGFEGAVGVVAEVNDGF